MTRLGIGRTASTASINFRGSTGRVDMAAADGAPNAEQILNQLRLRARVTLNGLDRALASGFIEIVGTQQRRPTEHRIENFTQFMGNGRENSSFKRLASSIWFWPSPTLPCCAFLSRCSRTRIADCARAGRLDGAEQGHHAHRPLDQTHCRWRRATRLSVSRVIRHHHSSAG